MSHETVVLSTCHVTQYAMFPHPSYLIARQPLALLVLDYTHFVPLRAKMTLATCQRWLFL